MFIDKDTIMGRYDISIEDRERLKGLFDIYDLFLESYRVLEKIRKLLDFKDPLNITIMSSTDEIRNGLSRIEYDIIHVLIKYADY